LLNVDTVERKIGEGGYGAVVVAQSESGVSVVVKMSQFLEEEDLQAQEQEFKMMKLISASERSSSCALWFFESAVVHAKRSLSLVLGCCVRLENHFKWEKRIFFIIPKYECNLDVYIRSKTDDLRARLFLQMHSKRFFWQLLLAIRCTLEISLLISSRSNS
jgi:hypothetical protein